jgi:hypothetical protein
MRPETTSTDALGTKIDRRRLLAVRLEILLALAALVASFGFGDVSNHLIGVSIGTASFYWFVFGLIALVLCRQNVRQGLARPNLERPANIYPSGVLLVVATILSFATVDTRDQSWTVADYIALLLLLGSISAFAWWTYETRQRWLLTYSVPRWWRSLWHGTT